MRKNKPDPCDIVAYILLIMISTLLIGHFVSREKYIMSAPFFLIDATSIVLLLNAMKKYFDE